MAALNDMELTFFQNDWAAIAAANDAAGFGPWGFKVCLRHAVRLGMTALGTAINTNHKTLTQLETDAGTARRQAVDIVPIYPADRATLHSLAKACAALSTNGRPNPLALSAHAIRLGRAVLVTKITTDHMTLAALDAEAA